jgi:hypothetical protein
MLAALLPGMAMAEKEGTTANQEDSGIRVLRFPPGLTVPEEIKANMPDWVQLNANGTLPEKLVLPEDVYIPKTVELPERMVSVPEKAKDGSVVWKEYKAPAVTINLAEALDYEGSRARALHSGYVTPYDARVEAALWGHCISSGNYALFNSSGSGFQGHSYLPTWTPTHGSVESWDIAPHGSSHVLCIPKSLFWTYIAGQPPHISLALLSAYNWDYNWLITYYN